MRQRVFLVFSNPAKDSFTVQQIIEDKDLGKIIINVHPRARHFVFRTKPDAIYVSIPPGSTKQQLAQAIENLRQRLLANRQALPVSPLIDLNYRIDCEHFKLSLVSGTKNKFLARSELGKMEIVCPPEADFKDEALQEWFHKVIEEALRRNAKVVLPPMLEALARANHLVYRSVKINSSRGRWGSCSGSKNINLSYFLLLLPSHLIEYVLLHELCHTIEMNHGEKFWALLNRMTDGKALALREELRKYQTSI